MRKIFFLLLFFYSATKAQQVDVLIKHAKLIDGTGNSWIYADIAVKDGKIAAIGHLNNYTANKIIDATGLIAAPGFIDVHTHDACKFVLYAFYPCQKQ